MAEAPYILETLLLSGFRAYLEPKTFDFGTKRCLAVFAPNGSGKSSIVDALEFMFSADGTLDRLGVRAVDNQAGVVALAHNLAAEKKIPSLVAVRFKRGDKKLDGSRDAVGPLRPRPAVADAVTACFLVPPIIRGHTLRGFVEAQKAEKRYEEVARWLQLGPLVDVQRNLRALRQHTKATCMDRGALKGIDTRLAKQTANTIMAWDDAAVLAYANTIVAQVDNALSLKSLDRIDPALVTLRDRASVEDKQLGLEGLRQLRQTAAMVCEQKQGAVGGGIVTTGVIPEFELAKEAQSVAMEAEAAERHKAASAAFAELWTVAEPLFAGGAPTPINCPICATPIVDSVAGSAEGVRRHIAGHLAQVADYARAKKALDDATTTINKIHARLVAVLRALRPLLTDLYADLRAALDTYLGAVESWKGGALPDAAALKASLHQLTSKLDASIAEIQTKQGDKAYGNVVTKLEHLIELREERELSVRTLAELEKLSTALNGQAAFISGEIRKRVQSLLDTLRSPINDIYRQIQGTDARPIKLELPHEEDTTQQRLNLVVDFATNRKGVQPGGYLSDSQIHSLALALRLAAIRQFNTAAPMIVLDDIVTSYDANHRRAIAALLASNFTDFQLIVTTHDERFFHYLKDQLGETDWHFTRIIRLDADFGPRFVDHRVTDAMIEARWHAGESAANEMRQAEEEWLLQLCRDFGVNVRIRPVEKAYSYERSELAAAVEQYLRDQGLTAPLVPGVNNRFLTSLQRGAIENFGSHFQESPHGDGSKGDEQARWKEFKFFRGYFVCPKCGKTRFKHPFGMKRAVCANEGCEAQFEFTAPADPTS